jgi:hypothetical protein
MLYRRRIDPSAYLVLWQIGVAGDQSLTRFSTGNAYRQVLVDVLARAYPREHQVFVYEATTLPTRPASIVTVALRQLPEIAISMHATLVVPPTERMQPDPEVRARLAALDSLNR